MTDSPLTLVKRLHAQIDRDKAVFDKLERYYTGRQPLNYIDGEILKECGDRLKPLVLNWPRIVIGAVEERIDVEGFRLAEDKPGDKELWRIWQANNLDEMSQLGHVEALLYGRAFATVWAGDDEDTPRIAVESPRQMGVLYAPGSNRVTAALKRWTSEDALFCTLWTDTAILRYRAARVRGSEPSWQDADWQPRSAIEDQARLDNTLGLVPVVPLVNRPRLMNPLGESELVDVLPIADAVNKLATDMMVSAEFHAIPRRWGTGVQPPIDEKTGEELSPFEQLVGRMWTNPSESARFGQFPEAELQNFVNAIRMLSGQLASIAHLPPHYLGLTTDNPASADAIRSSEASLVMTARRKQRSWGGSWEQVMRLAAHVRDGEPLPAGEMLETIWRNPETPTIAQKADAAAKLYPGKPIISRRQAQEDLGYTPGQQTAMDDDFRREAAETATAVAGLFDQKA